MGRPKKYTPEFIEAERLALLEYTQVIAQTGIPFKQEFAIKRGYSSQRLSEWAKDDDEFSEALKRLEDVQLLNLVKAMLKKKIDVAGAIFTLKNVAGWRDKKSMEHEMDDGTRRMLGAALKKLDKLP